MKKLLLVLFALTLTLSFAASAQNKTLDVPWGTPTEDGIIGADEWPADGWVSDWAFNPFTGADGLPGDADMDARWNILHDADNIYIVIDVTDDVRSVGAAGQSWTADNVEIWFDAANTKTGAGIQNRIAYVDDTWGVVGDTAGVTATVVDTGTAYVMEVTFSKTGDGLDTAIVDESQVGFEIKPHDNDSDPADGTREDQAYWSSDSDAWNNAAPWGTLTLLPEPVAASVIEQDGDAVAAHNGDADLTDGAFTLQHVLGAAAGEDRVVVILVQAESTGDGSASEIPITSVTYDGVAATEEMGAYGNPGEMTFRQQTNIFYINDADLPATAGTYDVTITYGEGTVDDATLGVVAFTGVSQSGPASSGNDAAPLSVETTSSISLQAYIDGSVAIDVAGGGQNDTTLTVDSAQTELFNIAGASARGAGSTKDIATAGATSMSYTVGGNMNRYAHSAVLFSPAGGVAAAPVITSNISPQFVTVGDNVVLTAPEGSGYQWYKNGAMLDGETDATLTLNNIQVANAGTYRVSYTGDAGSATTPGLWLQVQPAGAVPVSGLMGLAALMGACGIGGASMLRRRK